MAGGVAPSIPDHRLTRIIAVGAYGEVWLGCNALGTWRAIKVVRRDQHLTPEPFERELKGLRRFEPVSRSHDGFVDVLALGLLVDGSGFYYVMELADPVDAPTAATANQGSAEATSASSPYRPRTLRADLASRGPMQADEVVLLGLKLVAALAHLHRQGLVHRDIKPSNILFISGEPKLADPGLVTTIDDASSMVGTAGYIAPEGPGSPPADLYALGKVLYEAAFGKHRQEFPALPSDVSMRPDHAQLLELNEIIARACAHDPHRRYSSAEEMREDLVRLHGGQSVRRRLGWSTWTRLRGWRSAAVGAAVLLAAGLILSRNDRRFHRVPSISPEAAVLYQQAKGLLNQQTRTSVLLAYETLTRAIKLDPSSLDAYYGIFECYFSEVGDQLPPHTNRMSNYRWVSEQMRRLDSNSAQYHTTVAYILFNEWKWDEEIAHLKLAISADPGFTRAHGLYGGVLLRARGDPQGALAEFRAAERCDGFDAIIQMHLGTPYYVMGDFTNAIAQFRRAIALGMNEATVWSFLGLAYEANGQLPEALDCYEREALLDPDAKAEEVAKEFGRERLILSRSGPRALWQARLEEVRVSWPDPYELAGLHARLGETDQALKFLEEAFQRHHPAMREIMVAHFWQPLYRTPEFQQLLSRMGMRPAR